MAVELRYAARHEYDSVSRFLNEYWANDHIYVRSKPLFDWTFGRSNLWPDDTYTFAVAENGSELVGILGGIPFVLNQFGQKSRGVWIVNYVIRPDHRKGTMALQLLSKFRRPEFPTVVAFGINPATSAIYRVLRGQVLPSIPRYLAVMPHAVDRMMSLLQIAHPEWEAAKLRALAEACRLPGVPDTSVSASGEIPSTWDTDAWPKFAAQAVGAERDIDYLTWRYLRHPTFQYRVITVDDPDGPGLAVWRMETIRQKTPEGLKDVDRMARLVEFLPSSHANALRLGAAFLQQASTEGAMAADFYGYHACVRRWLADSGFVCADDLADGDGLPSRFQPLDGKGGGIMSAMFGESSLPACSSDPSCAWYWTKSDSDQDRPN
jgi:hypothetical protein